MTQLPEKETIRKTHLPGFKGLCVIYSWKKFWKSIIKPLITTLFIFLLFLLFSSDIIGIIKVLVELSLNVMPNLLGFLLGGYAIVISFGNENFLKSTSLISEKKPVSKYQIFSGIFAATTLSIAFSLIVAFLFSIVSLVPVPLFVPDILIKIINYLALFLMLFVGIYAIFQIPTMIFNIFDFSQMFHIKLVSEIEYDNQKKKQENGKEDST